MTHLPRTIKNIKYVSKTTRVLLLRITIFPIQFNAILILKNTFF